MVVHFTLRILQKRRNNITLSLVSLLPSPPFSSCTYLQTSFTHHFLLSLTVSYSLPLLLSLPLPSSPSPSHYSSVNRPPVVRLYRLPDPASLYTPLSPACPVACTLLSVLFDTQHTDTRLASMIHALPPPVIEVCIVQYSTT